MGGFPYPFGMTAWLVHNFGPFAIAAWYGSIASIPSTFVICDGTNGTPDLRDKFIAGAGQAYPVDYTAGSLNHNHDFNDDGHDHFFPPPGDIASGVLASQTTNLGYATGTTDTELNKPPFHGLVYIMEV